ncbi:hypothetical protein [Rhodoferax sp.]|nr:hypothetical protein [Rhodoferax sp.]
MKKQGKVQRWDATRGFGFIRRPETVVAHCADVRGGFFWLQPKRY